jgi:hypothetical protein
MTIGPDAPPLDGQPPNQPMQRTVRAAGQNQRVYNVRRAIVPS